MKTNENWTNLDLRLTVAFHPVQVELPAAKRDRHLAFLNKSLTHHGQKLSWDYKFVMADNIPNIPSGAVPPKKETGKVQPKKETVRINLPPKPSAAPTIKLPTLPPGGPTGATSAPAAAAPAAAPAPAAPSIPRAAAAPVAQRGAAPVSTAPRPAPARAAAPEISGVDKFLAIAAAVVGLVAAGSTLYLIYGIPTQ